MGRRVATELESRVREVRLAHGISQAQLAQRCGLTRQAISAIESGHYVPNTTVSLRLAQTLGCTVEELFTLPAALELPGLRVVGGAAPHEQRLAVVNVGGQWVGYPLVDARELQPGFVRADVILGPGRSRTELLAPANELAQTALLLGCDPGLGIVSSYLAAHKARLRWLSVGSQAALDAVGRGEAHLAGTHLPTSHGADDNLSHARVALGPGGGLVVEFARWLQGFAVAPGNPKEIRSVEDLARPEVRLVNREPGSGSRALLDLLLDRSGIPRHLVDGYDRLSSSHLGAASVVASGGADVAVTLYASAHAYGLDFLPLDEVRFDFVIPRSVVTHATVATLLEVMQSRALRADIGSLPGYDVTRMGTVLADLPAAA
jgi:putative molybdopterin biosynthesis protein